MIKVNRKELVEKLNRLKYGLPKGNIVQDDYCFLFFGGRIYTYNDDVCISTKFDMDNDFAVRADEFLSTLQKITPDIFTLIVTEKTVKIKAKNYKAEVACTDSESLRDKIESLKIGAGRKWKKLPEGFSEGLKLCSFSVGANMTNVIFTYINVDNNKVMSSDEYRVSEYKMKEEIEDNLLLRGTAAIDLVKFDMVKYFVEKGGIYFKNKEYVFWVRKDELEREYPDFSSDFKFKGSSLEFPEDTKDLVDFCSIFSQEDFELKKKITVNISDGKIMVIGEASGVGKGSAVVDIDYNKKDINFEIHPRLFLEVLNKTMRVKIGEDRVLFRWKGFRHLLGLVEE